jgi:ketosteroid isomerase-like protein
MSQENLEIARRLNEAVNRGDLPAVLELLDPAFEWWDRADDPGATVHRGHAGYSKFIAELDANVVEMQVELKELVDVGDGYVIADVRVHGRGRASNAPFDENEVHVLRLRDGKATELREYRNRAEALEAVGLSK